MKIIERLHQYLEFKGLKPAQFERQITLSNGYLGKQLKRNADLGEGIILKIIENCPEIDINWLISGKGNMITGHNTYFQDDENITELVNEPEQKVFRLKTDKLVNSQSIPLYDIEATAGIVALFNNAKSQNPIDHISIPNLPKCDGAVYVTGDSMYPLLKSGDIVMYKEIRDIKNEIFWGEMYLLSVEMSGEEFVMVKYIQKAEDPEFIKLVSQNKYHQDKEVEVSKIRALALVKASIRVNSMN